MNYANNFLLIVSYVCGLNSELFLYTDKNNIIFFVGD